MKFHTILMGAAALIGVPLMASCTKAEQTAVTSLPAIDMSAWLYDADGDAYYQTGLSYAESPADPAYETLGLYVPGAYFSAKENGDGTYTCTVNKKASAGGYTAQNAPYVILVETPGYSACEPPSGYVSSTKTYTDAGFIYIYPGCRGRTHGAPAGVTDLKAAIRYVRYNGSLLPGDTERLFSFGMSGGGAQSALVGATGDAKEYEPYLEAIGAVRGVSDAVMGSMCWCPITNLDQANQAYEWNMGMTRTDLDAQEQALSDAMAASYAAYINSISLTDKDGTVLSLEESDEGIWQKGTYYDYIVSVIETSLGHFLSDTSFPYDASASGSMGGFGGGFGGMGGPGGGHGEGGFPGGGFPDGGMPGGMQGGPAGGGDYSARDNIRRTSASGGLSLSGTYETAEDYIAALNSEGEWVSYDKETGSVRITSVAAFTKALKNASKSVGAFDALDATQGENVLFGFGDGNGAHFDKTMAQILSALGSDHAASYASDIAKTDALGTTMQQRLDMYTPLYYLNGAYGGYRTASVAPHWRIRSGISQGDTALCTEVNLALALENYGIQDVDFETVWALQHVKAERSGDSDGNFIAWVNSILQ